MIIFGYLNKQNNCCIKVSLGYKEYTSLERCLYPILHKKMWKTTKMKQTELIAKLQETFRLKWIELSKNKTLVAFNNVFSTISDLVESGERVYARWFGFFKKYTRKPRAYRILRNGRVIEWISKQTKWIRFENKKIFE